MLLRDGVPNPMLGYRFPSLNQDGFDSEGWWIAVEVEADEIGWCADAQAPNAPTKRPGFSVAMVKLSESEIPMRRQVCNAVLEGKGRTCEELGSREAQTAVGMELHFAAYGCHRGPAAFP